MRRRAFVLAFLLALALMAKKHNEPQPSILYGSDCTEMSGWEWIFEGCWWRT